MSHRIAACSFLVIQCLALGPLRGASAATTPGRAWRPADASAVVISVTRWPAAAGLESFDAENRRDEALVETLEERGIPSERIAVLTDEKATATAALAALRRVAASARPGGLLIVALQGHGLKVDGATRLAVHDYQAARPGETGLSLPAVGELLVESWRGGKLLLIGDFCYSGALARVAHRVSAAGKGPAAAICSAVDSDRSTSRWTFLDAVTEALAGHADVDENEDGSITFRELTAWVIGAMVHAEDQMAEVAMAGGFPADLVVARVDPAARHARAPDGRRPGDGVDARDAQGDWYPARLLRFANGRWLVRFSGWGPDVDEWVDPAQLRKPSPSPWRAGDHVEVEWVSDEWYAARIVEVAGARMHFVHYEDTDSEDDEWVPASRIRKSAGRGRATEGPLRRARTRELRKRLKSAVGSGR